MLSATAADRWSVANPSRETRGKQKKLASLTSMNMSLNTIAVKPLSWQNKL